MPTPLDKFPPIPEDDGLGGSGNESHEQKTLKESTPPAAADTQSVKRLPDKPPSFGRKSTAKHSAAERKSSNKLQRKGTLRRQVRWLHSHHLAVRSEEHTSELQSPVPISYAVFCLKKKKKKTNKTKH